MLERNIGYLTIYITSEVGINVFIQDQVGKYSYKPTQLFTRNLQIYLREFEEVERFLKVNVGIEIL